MRDAFNSVRQLAAGLARFRSCPGADACHPASLHVLNDLHQFERPT